MMTAPRWLGTALICLLISPAAFGHYHFLRYASRSAPFRAIPLKFDLNVLPNRTLSYFVSESGNVQLSAQDSISGLLSQIRSAARVWNDVEHSDLRLAFGGLISPGLAMNAPTMEFTFEEMPPGIVAMGGVTRAGDTNGAFIPILQSVVRVQPNLTERPSYSEALYGTFVHEIGHALGLQHSWSSGVMSTRETRGITKADPLAADDIAGLQVLYGSQAFRDETGSVTGRVSNSGSGVALASVVAISPNGAVVSTLTNPDGTYRIDGIPPRQYLLYVHPLPPALRGQSSPGDIVFPTDPSGQDFNPSGAFDTIFFPNTKNPSQAFPVTVAAGGATENIDFNVRSRSAVALHSLSAFAFPNTVAVQPPTLSPEMRNSFLVVSGVGLVSENAPARGLSVMNLSGAPLAVRPYASAPASFAQVDVDIRGQSFGGESVRHLVFGLNNDIYVLPSAYSYADRLPPSVTSVTAGIDEGVRVAIISGTQLSARTRILFDGTTGIVKNFDETSRRLTVIPPSANANHKANVVALNPDGQSSLMWNAFPPVYTYGQDGVSLNSLRDPSGLSLAAATTIPAGADAAVQIDAPGGSFIEGQVSVGFGTSDIAVKRLWVASPTRVIANISVSPSAIPSALPVTVASGLQWLHQPSSLAVTPLNSRGILLQAPVVSGSTNQPILAAGGQGRVTVRSTSVPLSGNAYVFLNDQQVPVVGVTNNQITFAVPAGFSDSLALLRVEASGERSLPVAVQIGSAPPQIVEASINANAAIDPARGVKPGDILSLVVTNLVEAKTSIDPAKVKIALGTASVSAAVVLEHGSGHKVMLAVPRNIPAGSQQVIVSVGDRASEPFSLPFGS